MYTRLFNALAAGIVVTGIGLQAPSSHAQIPPPANWSPKDRQMLQATIDVLTGNAAARGKALDWLEKNAGGNAIPSLIQALRFRRTNARIRFLPRKLSGNKTNNTWFEWMVWQEAHPEVKPHKCFPYLKHYVFTKVDPQFNRFVRPGLKMDIRLEEVTWGGVRVDGIPALINPKHTSASRATWLADSNEVFGVVINGDARAYPLRILNWHEMFNDTVGGVPVALAYCTLCGAGILFDRRVAGRKKPFTFGSSGLLYRSNKLMYDRETDSMWNQFTGQPVSGKLRGSGIRLKVLPVVITSWKKWRRRYPDTKVLSLATGYTRNYSGGAACSRYFSSLDLMFPTVVGDKRLRAKDQVFGVRMPNAQKAWPLAAFAGGRVINDKLGDRKLVLIGDSGSRTVRAYRREEWQFRTGARPDQLVDQTGGVWRLTATNLIGPKGQKLARVAGHVAYWFAWSGYFGPKTELYTRGKK